MCLRLISVILLTGLLTSPSGIKNDESRIKTDELCIQNDELCIENDELCIQNDELCIQNDKLVTRDDATALSFFKRGYANALNGAFGQFHIKFKTTILMIENEDSSR